MFEVNGVYGNKFYPNGQVSRMKSTFKMQLNTEEGVIRFIEEQKPFYEINIRNILDNKDMTSYFLDKLNVKMG